MNEVSFDLLIFTGSFFAGLLGSLIGLGGAIIVTPLLVLGFGIDIRYAMGAALTSVIATSSGAAAALLRDGFSNMKLGVFLCIATTFGAVGGALLSAVLDPQFLSVIFGIVLVCSGVLSLRKARRVDPAHDVSDPIAVRLGLEGNFPQGEQMRPYRVHRVIPGFFLMSIAGLLSGLLGIGSGTFKVLAMDQVMKVPFRVTTATSNFMIGVTAAASAGIYLKRGYLDPVLVSPVALGVLAGAVVGAWLLPKAPLKMLKGIFLSAIFLVGLEMILQGFHIRE